MANIENSEIEKFERMAKEWWDEKGKFKPLHQMNPVRIGFVKESITHHFNLEDKRNILEGLKILDVGCGGGLLSEPLARLGGNVKAIDASKINIEIAKKHAKESGVHVTYSNENLEDLPQDELYDVVIALEVIEHTIDPADFVKSLCKRVKPEGLVIISTLNKNIKSYMMAIIGAEYILRWLPRGTHDWNKFMKPSEVALLFEENQFKISKMQGMIFNPFDQTWSLSDSDLSVNYAISFKKSS